VDGHVVMYADNITASMRFAIDETERRRALQEAHNREHGITPEGISKAIRDITDRVKAVAETRAVYTTYRDMPKDDLMRAVKDLESQMRQAARNLEFEKAALLRDEMVELRRLLVGEEEAKVAAAGRRVERGKTRR
jgi:excinuclease ABC subunit B